MISVQLWLTHIFPLIVENKNKAKGKGKERENVGSAREDHQVVQVVENDRLCKIELVIQISRFRYI